MLLNVFGRALRASPAAIALLVFSNMLMSCREDLPTGDELPAGISPLKFRPNDYFSYDNWRLDRFGSRIPGTRTRNSWTVIDTGAQLYGRGGAIVFMDSTFRSSTTGQDSLVRTDSVVFHVDSTGDVFWFGFVAGVVAVHESLSITPAWDRVAALSLPRGSSWVVGRIDTTDGGTRNETVFGTLSPSREYVAASLNGTVTAILAYRIEMTKQNFFVTIWITSLPASLARLRDESTILNSTLREVTQIVVSGR